jgi:3-hydroxy acid dehydrogenase / malonic semialdehyde reductase
MDGLESLNGRRVLVTGGTTGIGRAIAKRLVKGGAKVVIFGRHEEPLQDALADIGSGATGLVADASKEGDLARVFAHVDEELGGLDALVNNAGVAAESVESESPESIRSTIETNLTGYMEAAHMALQRLKQEGKGDVVNVGSQSAVSLSAGGDVYAGSKAGVQGWSLSLQKGAAKSNVRVSLVEPGLVEAELQEGKSQAEKDEQMAKKEMLQADDIAKAVEFILSLPDRVAITRIGVVPIHQDNS